MSVCVPVVKSVRLIDAENFAKEDPKKRARLDRQGAIAARFADRR